MLEGFLEEGTFQLSSKERAGENGKGDRMCKYPVVKGTKDDLCWLSTGRRQPCVGGGWTGQAGRGPAARTGSDGKSLRPSGRLDPTLTLVCPLGTCLQAVRGPPPLEGHFAGVHFGLGES